MEVLRYSMTVPDSSVDVSGFKPGLSVKYTLNHSKSILIWPVLEYVAVTYIALNRLYKIQECNRCDQDPDNPVSDSGQ